MHITQQCFTMVCYNGVSLALEPDLNSAGLLLAYMHKLERGRGSLLPGRMSIVVLVMQEHDLHDLQG